MEQKNKSGFVLCFAALALLLCIAFFVISAAPAFARYRDEFEDGIVFEVREPEHICFGKFVEDKFVPLEEGEDIRWEVSGDTAKLTLTVANGSSRTKYFSEDQKINIQLAAGLAFKEKEVSLAFSEGNSERVFSGTAAEIQGDSAFYKTYGAGVLFSFMENETEFSYILEGEKFSCLTFTITVDISGLEETSLLQPHITAEVIKKD